MNRNIILTSCLKIIVILLLPNVFLMYYLATRGMLPADCEENYLTTIVEVETYGVDLYHASWVRVGHLIH